MPKKFGKALPTNCSKFRVGKHRVRLLFSCWRLAF